MKNSFHTEGKCHDVSSLLPSVLQSPCSLPSGLFVLHHHLVLFCRVLDHPCSRRSFKKFILVTAEQMCSDCCRLSFCCSLTSSSSSLLLLSQVLWSVIWRHWKALWMWSQEQTLLLSSNSRRTVYTCVSATLSITSRLTQDQKETRHRLSSSRFLSRASKALRTVCI